MPGNIIHYKLFIAKIFKTKHCDVIKLRSIAHKFIDSFGNDLAHTPCIRLGFTVENPKKSVSFKELILGIGSFCDTICVNKEAVSGV